MDALRLDCRTLPCPQPIMRLKQALAKAAPSRIHVVVDNEPALENVCRFLASQGYASTHIAEQGQWLIEATRNQAAMNMEGGDMVTGAGSDAMPASAAAALQPRPAAVAAGTAKGATADRTGGGAPANAPNDADGNKVMVMLVSPFMGTGDDTLGAKLMQNFLATLPELGDSLWRLVLLNGGVILSVEDSPVISELRALEQAGTEILVCGACLDDYGLIKKKAVGQTTNMLDIVTGMQLADKVIRI